MTNKEKKKFLPTDKQVKLFNDACNAIKACSKAGLVIYAKSNELVAYTRFANDYIENEHGFEKLLGNGNNQVYCLSKSVLQDSGADDYPSYAEPSDDPNNEIE